MESKWIGVAQPLAKLSPIIGVFPDRTLSELLLETLPQLLGEEPMAAVVGMIDGVVKEREIRKAFLREMFPARGGVGEGDVMFAGEVAQGEHVGAALGFAHRREAHHAPHREVRCDEDDLGADGLEAMEDFAVGFVHLRGGEWRIVDELDGDEVRLGLDDAVEARGIFRSVQTL